MSIGSIAVVGSGEYLPSMLELESLLISDGVANGKKPIFVQLATAAGRESKDSLDYWKRIGQEQASRLGVEAYFLPVFNRADAESEELVELVSNAALVYFSGGDPNHLANSMRETVLWKAIQENYYSGGSLAGCSAGAMFMSAQVPRLRLSNKPVERGVGLLPNLQVIPHFNMIHRWIPDAAVRALADIPKGVLLVGIDDGTSLLRRGDSWSVWGSGLVHVLNGDSPRTYQHLEMVPGI
ncbi:MAG: Type 1 glutamine amidotransferase-like domain-containing protein [Actinobacteria bacterium]|nr:Type 1 glutamine amidotransferase-like domain-containing protein [Actinomycetota bacterium]